jgi:ubiquinone biosynthesis protein
MALLFDPEKGSLLRSAPRLMQILRVLTRHKFLGALRGKNHWPSPKELKETFEELGVTFIKLGQVLALRRDLLPEPYIEELEKLLDQQPAQDFHAVRTIVEFELSAPLSELFSTFSETPLAAATIAQVHEATTLDGRHVVVKVQRPGLGKKIAKDIAALNSLVALGERLYPQLYALDLPVLVRELAESLDRETDFRREARSIALFRTALADIPDFWIPDVLTEYSSGAVLTMEFSAGERVDLFAESHPEAMPKAMSTLVRVMLQTIFEDGLFHADPHSGNVFVLPDGRLCLLDFGMIGELDEPMRESLTLLLEAVVNKDTRGATNAYLEMATASEKVNRAKLMVDMKVVLREIHRQELVDVSVGNAFAALLRAGSRNGVHNPGDFFLLTRAFVIMESMMRQLDPQFDFMEAFREEIKRLTVQRFSLERIKDKTGSFVREMERLINDAPGDTRRVLRRIAEGDLGRLQAPAVEALGGRVSRDLKRLTDAIVASALLIGGSMLVNAPLDAGWHHIFGEGMIVAGVFTTVTIGIAALRRERGRGQDRR